MGSLPLVPAGKPLRKGNNSFFSLKVVIKYFQASLVAQLLNNLPAMWETWVRSLGWEDPLEKGKATHSSILLVKIALHLKMAKKFYVHFTTIKEK